MIGDDVVLGAGAKIRSSQRHGNGSCVARPNCIETRRSTDRTTPSTHTAGIEEHGRVIQE
jgi:hypothetical protein